MWHAWEARALHPSFIKTFKGRWCMYRKEDGSGNDNDDGEDKVGGGGRHGRESPHRPLNCTTLSGCSRCTDEGTHNHVPIVACLGYATHAIIRTFFLATQKMDHGGV